MLNALQLCGASLDDYLHLLVSPIVKVFQNSCNSLDVRKYVTFHPFFKTLTNYF